MTAHSIDNSTSHVTTAHQFLVLAKPRIGVMVLLTVAVAGLISVPVSPSTVAHIDMRAIPFWKLIHSMIGLLLVSASGCALNQYLERYVDWIMPRTAKRPLPNQTLSAAQVATFGAITFGVGIAYLLTLVNWSAVLIAVASWFLYVWIYTPLKMRSWINTYVGAIAGAMPVLIGSAAVAEGQITISAWLLFAVLYIWQFPHFMAIAWMYRDDYRAADIKMITVDDPEGRRTGRHAIVFASLLLPVTTAALWPTSFWTAVILLISIGLVFWYWWASIRFAKSPSNQSAKQLFRVSLIYLPCYLVALTLAVWL